MNRNHKKTVLFLFALAAAAALALLILSFSLRSGVRSNAQSEQVKRAVAALMHSLGLRHPDLRFIDWFYPHGAHADLGNILVRKAAHGAEYALFGFACALALSFLRSRRLAVALNLAAGPLLALFDEKYVQATLSVGRTSSYRDVALDSLGFFAGSLVAVLLLHLFAARRKKRSV